MPFLLQNGNGQMQTGANIHAAPIAEFGQQLGVARDETCGLELLEVAGKITQGII
jgi:hypothetical protein